MFPEYKNWMLAGEMNGPPHVHDDLAKMQGNSHQTVCTVIVCVFDFIVCVHTVCFYTQTVHIKTTSDKLYFQSLIINQCENLLIKMILSNKAII